MTDDRYQAALAEITELTSLLKDQTEDRDRLYRQLEEVRRTLRRTSEQLDRALEAHRIVVAELQRLRGDRGEAA